MAGKDRLVVPGLTQQMPDLNPVARPSDTFTYAPRESEPGKPLQTNSLIEAAKAMDAFNPPLLGIIAQKHAEFTEEEVAKGTAAYHANRMTWNDLVKQNKVPLGASPYFAKAYQQSQLRDNAADYSMYLANEYKNDQNGIQSTDDPLKVRSWMTEKANAYRESKFRNKDGSLAFSPLDIKEVFDPLQTQANDSMLRAHIGNRIKDHEAIGLQTASTEISKILDFYGQGGFTTQDGKEYEDVGAKINAALFAPVTGLVANGLDRTVANKLIVDTVADYAVRTGDRGAINIAKGISTGSGKLGDTAYAKQALYAAELHITEQNWKQETRDRSREDWVVQGTLEERLAEKAKSQAHTDQAFAQATERYNREMESYARLDVTTGHKRQIDSEKAMIVTAVLEKDFFNPLVTRSMKNLAILDPDAAKAMSDWLNKSVKDSHAFEQTEEGRTTFNDIRKDMSTNPEKFNSSRIHKAGNDNLLSDTQVGQLWDDWERLRTNMDHPYLRGPVYHASLEALAKGISSDPNFNQKGEGALIAANAQFQFRVQAQQWITDHTKNGQEPSATEFNEYVANSLRPNVLKFNKEMLDAEMEKTAAIEAAKQKRQEALAKPEVKEKPRSLTDKILMRPKQFETVPPPPAPEKSVGEEPLTPMHLKTLLTGGQREELTNIMGRIRKGGKDGVKPVHEQEVRDAVRHAYEPIYNTYRKGKTQELVDAIEQTVDAMMGRKPKEPKK